MADYPQFGTISESLKKDPKVIRGKQTMVVDIENTFVTQIEIQNEMELNEIRKSSNYRNCYIEVKFRG